MIDSPSDAVPEKAQRWDLTGTEGYTGEKVFLWTLLVVWEYLGIYRGGIRSRGATRGPQSMGGGGMLTPSGAPPELVAPSWLCQVFSLFPPIGLLRRPRFDRTLIMHANVYDQDQGLTGRYHNTTLQHK